MAVRIKARVGYGMPRGWENSALAKKVFWRLMRQAAHAGAERWAKDTLPKHFTREAYGLYPVYFPRAAGKRGPPLVDTGDLKRKLKYTVPKPRAARGTAVARVHLTVQKEMKQRGVPEKRRGIGQNPLAGWKHYKKELVAMADREIKSLQRFLAQYMKTAIVRDKMRRRKSLV